MDVETGACFFFLCVVLLPLLFNIIYFCLSRSVRQIDRVIEHKTVVEFVFQFSKYTLLAWAFFFALLKLINRGWTDMWMLRVNVLHNFVCVCDVRNNIFFSLSCISKDQNRCQRTIFIFNQCTIRLMKQMRHFI